MLKLERTDYRGLPNPVALQNLEHRSLMFSSFLY